MNQQQAEPTTPKDPAPAPPRRNSVLRVVIGLVVAAAMLGAGLWLARDDPGNAQVGDCVAGSGTEDMQIVECGSAEAQWQVIGRVEDKVKGEMESACLPFKAAQRAFWQGEQGEPGLVLCLKPAG